MVFWRIYIIGLALCITSCVFITIDDDTEEAPLIKVTEQAKKD